MSDDTKMQHNGRIPAYNKLAAEAGERLDDALADIRTSQDARKLTVREAADNRVAVLKGTSAGSASSVTSTCDRLGQEAQIRASLHRAADTHGG